MQHPERKTSSSHKSVATASSGDDLEKQVVANAVFENNDVSSIAWRHLTVTVKDRDSGHTKILLDNVSGFAEGGDLIALMGPSGSGKTTLLNSLARRAPGTIDGQILINGNPSVSLARFRAITSFVEQEDTLIGSLTVEETLMFAAQLALPRNITRVEKQKRVDKLLQSFGLLNQRHTRVGTPLLKGLSGGQKRRLSVAMQLITGPRILFLDEPTSGLDSTASFEIVSYLRAIAKQYKLIIVTSIHQPSTKTYNLFDKVLLLARGKTCFFGPVELMPLFFQGLHSTVAGDDRRPVSQINPAELVLDMVNDDFATDSTSVDENVASNLSRIHASWTSSIVAADLDHSLEMIPVVPLAPERGAQKSKVLEQVVVLLHRSFIKSYRDIVVYWIRVAMYLGLAIMMGTVWLRLEGVQGNIQSFINAIFFGSAFMSFMAVAYVPAYLEDRAALVKERANGLCSTTAFVIANFLMGLPYLFLIAMLFSIVSYWLINLRPGGEAFMTWVLWLFLDLLAAESLVVLVASVFPNFVVALALTAFANGLWMSVGGFLVSVPVLNVFWRYVFHYIDYQAYVFQGMMVNEFKSRDYDCNQVGNGSCQCIYPSSLQDQCKIAGVAVLHEYGYELGKEGQWVGIMIAIIVVYRVLGWLAMSLRKN